MTSAQHSVEYSDSELHSFHLRYFGQLITYQIITALQIGLIISTIINFRRVSKERALTDSERRISNRMKWTFISVLSSGSLIFALVEWYGIADFLYDFAALTNYCDIAAILGNLSLITYLLALYIFYLYRLYATFRNSVMGLSSFTVKLLLTITFTTYFVLVTMVFILEKGAVKHTPFSWSMEKSSYKWIVICEGEFSIGIHHVLRWILQCIVVIGNTYYGIIFYKKLYDLLKQQQKKDEVIVKLMNKQATLIMVSTISTSILWSLTNILHYFGSFLQVLIYLDISINCFCLFLMFPWNEKLYIKLCKPCAAFNQCCCSSLLKSKQIENELDLYHGTSNSNIQGTESSPQFIIHSYDAGKPSTNMESTSV